IVALNRGPLVAGFGTPLPMTPFEVEEAVAAGAVVVDGRTNEQFDEAHIPGALSTSAYDTGFATKVSRVAPAAAELIVVAAHDVDEREAAELLAAVGLRVRGFLEGGMTAWRIDGRPVGRIELIDPAELARRVEEPGGPVILDVREESEYEAEHIPGSLHIPYGGLAGRVEEIPRDRPVAAICRGGKRSGLAASILRREGFAEVIHVGKGVGAWRAAGNPVESGPAVGASAV
ncbi:MAG TPA: rhodanese-like domain-containing protein, partial [Solirubrobacterales bacterium]